MKTLCLEGSPISISSLINHSHTVPRKSNYLWSKALLLSSKWKTAADETNHDLSLELAWCWASLLQRGNHYPLCSFHSSAVKWGNNTDVQDMVTPLQSRILFLFCAGNLKSSLWEGLFWGWGNADATLTKLLYSSLPLSLPQAFNRLLQAFNSLHQ